MRIRASCAGRALRLYFDGELDHHAAKRAMGEIEGYIDSRLPRDCVIDLGGLTFMDSSGIGVILGRYRTLSQRGGSVAVKNVNAHVEKIFCLSGMNQIIQII